MRETGKENQVHKHGCPYCGKPTAGMPTRTGFEWAVCEDCAKKIGVTGGLVDQEEAG